MGALVIVVMGTSVVCSRPRCWRSAGVIMTLAAFGAGVEITRVLILWTRALLIRRSMYGVSETAQIATDCDHVERQPSHRATGSVARLRRYAGGRAVALWYAVKHWSGDNALPARRAARWAESSGRQGSRADCASGQALPVPMPQKLVGGPPISRRSPASPAGPQRFALKGSETTTAQHAARPPRFRASAQVLVNRAATDVQQVAENTHAVGRAVANCR